MGSALHFDVCGSTQLLKAEQAAAVCTQQCDELFRILATIQAVFFRLRHDLSG